MSARPPTRLRARFAHFDVPCPECGYNLRGAPTDICPECGATVTEAALLEAASRAGGRGSVLGATGLLMLLSVALPSGIMIGADAAVAAAIGDGAAEGAVLAASLAAFAGGVLFSIRRFDGWVRWLAEMPPAHRAVNALLCWSWVAAPYMLRLFFEA